MSRQARALTVVPGLPHHIVLRGNNRRRLFSYPRDFLFFTQLLARSATKHAVPMHAFTFMPNHVHLVGTPPNAPALSSCVKGFAQEYAWRRNRSLDRSGKLFEERFFAKPITSDEQLAATIPYVELNPTRAGIADQPDAYRWTSYRLHAFGDDAVFGADLWTPHAWYIGLGSSGPERQERYRDIVTGILGTGCMAPRAQSRVASASADEPWVQRAERVSYSGAIADRRPDGARVADGSAAYGFGEIDAELE